MKPKLKLVFKFFDTTAKVDLIFNNYNTLGCKQSINVNVLTISQLNGCK